MSRVEMLAADQRLMDQALRRMRADVDALRGQLRAALAAPAAGPLPRPPCQAICEAVAERRGVTLAALRGPDRHQPLVWARQEAMAACVDAGYSLNRVGRYLGGRDHSTVLHGVRAHVARTAADSAGAGAGGAGAGGAGSGARAQPPAALPAALPAASTPASAAPSAAAGGLPLEQAVLLTGGTCAGRRALACRYGVTEARVLQAWHRARARG